MNECEPSWMKPVTDMADAMIAESKARGRVRSFGTAFGSPYSTEYFNGPVSHVAEYTVHSPSENPWDISDTTTMKTKMGATKNHPNAFKRRDGKTQCPDCHALSLDAVALDMIPCTVTVPKQSSPMDKFHIGSTPPPEAKLGDIWVDITGTVRVMIVDSVKDDPKTKTATWTAIRSEVENPVVYPAMWNGEMNANVVQVAFQKQVGYLKTMADTEYNYYRQAMMEEMLQYVAKNDLVLLTVPNFEIEPSTVSPGTATIGLHALARPRNA